MPKKIIFLIRKNNAKEKKKIRTIKFLINTKSSISIENTIFLSSNPNHSNNTQIFLNRMHRFNQRGTLVCKIREKQKSG